MFSISMPVMCRPHPSRAAPRKENAPNAETGRYQRTVRRHLLGPFAGPCAYLFAAALTALLLIAATASAAPAERRIALVVGNGAYARDPLANPPRDAALVATALERAGFDVIRIIDADRRTMETALVTFTRKLATGATVGLFYYAGHGVQVNGDNYLLPVDIDIRTESEVLLQGINLAGILATLRPDASRLAIAVLDACRNNPFSGLVRGLARGLAPVTAPAGTLIAFSTAPGEVALDGDGRNSPYSAALAAAIPTPGLTIEDVFKRTRQSVMQTTANAQVPWEHSSLTGDFTFVPGPSPGDDRETANIDPASDIRLAELTAWERAKTAGSLDDYTAFLERYPTGAFAELARYKINRHPARPNAWTWWLPKASITARPLDQPRSKAEELYERALRLEADAATPAARDEARTLYQRSAGAGFAPAMYRYARLIERSARASRAAGADAHATGDALRTAATWYAKGAGLGHPASERALATLHEFGEGATGDLAAALRLYRRAASAGDPGAMTSLGFLYATGKGVPRDPAAARDWYEKAAIAGSDRAMFNLAVMLMTGDGGAVDLAASAQWLEAAAARHNSAALRELAVVYDTGRGLARNPAAAARRLLQAYAAGDHAAQGDLFDHHRRWSRATRRAIQGELKRYGLYQGPLHGVFNAQTMRAISAYASHPKAKRPAIEPEAKLAASK